MSNIVAWYGRKFWGTRIRYAYRTGTYGVRYRNAGAFFSCQTSLQASSGLWNRTKYFHHCRTGSKPTYPIRLVRVPVPRRGTVSCNYDVQCALHSQDGAQQMLVKRPSTGGEGRNCLSKAIKGLRSEREQALGGVAKARQTASSNGCGCLALGTLSKPSC